MDLPNPGIEPRSPALQVGSLPAEPQGEGMIVRIILVSPHSNHGCLYKREEDGDWIHMEEEAV